MNPSATASFSPKSPARSSTSKALRPPSRPATGPQCGGRNGNFLAVALAASLMFAWCFAHSARSFAAAPEKNDAPADEKARIGKALVDAASLGKLEAVKDLLAKGADIHFRDPASNGKTPLTKSVVLGKFEVVKYLIENGADIHHPDGSGRYPVYFCCIGSNVEMLRYLLAKGGDQDLNRGPFPMLVSLCEHGQASPEFIPILIKAGISPDEFSQHFTPLIGALRLDQKVRKPEVIRAYVKALIENKADVNLRDKKEKMTPLQWAKKLGDQEIIDMLVKAGAKE